MDGGALLGTSWSIAADGSTTGFQISSGQLPASTSFLGPSISSGEVNFNYAGSGSKGGAATDLGCSNCVTLGSETSGNYAAGNAEGGAATSGDSATSFFSSGTIESARLPGTISYLGSSISSGEVDFNYAGSGSKGGAATDLGCSNCVALGSEITGNYAAGNAEGGAATNVACSNCVTLGSETSGNYAGSSSEGGKATDADKLDNIDSSSFLRSDTTDDWNGDLRGRQDDNLVVSDGYICVDDNGGSVGSCDRPNDGTINADDFYQNGVGYVDAWDEFLAPTSGCGSASCAMWDGYSLSDMYFEYLLVEWPDSTTGSRFFYCALVQPSTDRLECGSTYGSAQTYDGFTIKASANDLAANTWLNSKDYAVYRRSINSFQ